MTDKNQWRTHFRKEWERLMNEPDNFARQRQALLQNLRAFLQSREGLWSTYHALPSEISIDEIPEEVPHLKWVYPKVKGHRLHFFGPGPGGFEIAYAGIREPVETLSDEVAISQISGFLVPGLGFDQNGWRLGKGKGFFDRALQTAEGIKVGVSLSAFVTSSLPHEPHDIPMDVVVTEKGVWTKWKS
jgi:5-formyltetrahydrofolate cyclo-ligase